MHNTQRNTTRRVVASIVGCVLAAAAISPAAALAADPELTYQLAIGSVLTGSAPFDPTDAAGSDSSATNDIVRTFDSVTFQFEASVNSAVGGTGTATNSTFTFQLPDGMTWSTLPGTCLSGGTPASGISPDGRTAVCNAGAIGYGASRGIALTATVATLPQGTPLTFAADSLSFATDNVTTPAVTAQPAPITVSSAPNINMTKLVPSIAKNQVGPDGITRGWMIQYGVTFSIPNMPGKATRGYLPPTGPLTFTDDFSAVSPNAQFVRVETGAITNHAELPQFSTANSTAANSISNGGEWTAVAHPASQTVDVIITGADLSASHLPTVGRGGLPITNNGYMTFGKVYVFVPITDVPLDDAGEGSRTIVNTVGGFAPTAPDVGGTPVANVGDSPSDNRQQQVLIRQAAGEFNKRFVDVIRGSDTPYPVEGMSGDRTGDGTLVAGQQVQSMVQATNTSSDGDFSGMLVCDIWDSTQLALARYSTLPDPRWANPNGNPTSGTGTAMASGHFEYLTGYTLAGTDDQRWQAMRDFTCDDSAGTWTTQAAALAHPAFDLGAVSAVRFVSTSPVAAGQTATLLVNLEARSGIPNGQIVANMAGWQVPELAGGVFRGSNYNPQTNKTLPGGTATLADRLIAVLAPLGIAKRVTQPVAANPRVAAGSPASFELTPSFRTVNRPGPFAASEVTVTDHIPPGMHIILDAGTAAGVPVEAPNYAPASVTVLADGTTEVVWRFAEMTEGNLPVITYTVATESTGRGDYVNTAIIRSPDDAQSPASDDVAQKPSDAHRAAATIGIDGQVGISVSKAALNPFVTSGHDFSYEVTAANGSPATTQTGGTVIDVLPFVGDGGAGAVSRIPATDNTSQYVLSGPPTLPAGATAQYTIDPADEVQASQRLGAGEGPNFGGGITWVDFDQVVGMLDRVTALRVSLAPLGPQGLAKFRYTLTHVSGVEGGVFANNATLRTAQAALGVVSNTVTTRMASEVPSLTLVKSASVPANGIQAAVGETVSFGFTVTNNGEAPLTGVSLAEESFVDGNGRPLALTTPILPSDPEDFDGTLGVGETVAFTASYVVTQSDVDAGGQLTNRATVTGTPPTGPAVTDTSEVSVNMGDPDPALLLVKRAVSEPANGRGYVVGEILRYSFTVRNSGNVTIAGVTVAEDAFTNGAGHPLQLTEGPLAGEGFTGELAPGAQTVFTGSYEFTQADIDASGVMTNAATASGLDPTGGAVDNSDETVTSMGIADASIALVKSASDPADGVQVRTGETVTYTFTGTNDGAVTLHNVVLAETRFTNGWGDELQLSSPPTVVSPAGFDGTLPVGETVVYTAMYTVTQDDIDASGSITNGAVLTGSPEAGVPVSHGSEVSLNAGTPAPALTLVTSVTNAPASGAAFTPGETIEFAFTVRNTGNVTLRGVGVAEGGFTNAGGDARVLTRGPDPAAGFTGVLSPGEETVFTGAYRVLTGDTAPSGVSSMSNTAVATGTAPDGGVQSASSSVGIPVVAAPGSGSSAANGSHGESLSLTGGVPWGDVMVVVLALLGAGAVMVRRRVKSAI